VVPKSMPSTFAIKFKKMVVFSLFLCNYDAAIQGTTLKHCKQRTKMTFNPFLRRQKTTPIAPLWHCKSAIWHSWAARLLGGMISI